MENGESVISSSSVGSRYSHFVNEHIAWARLLPGAAGGLDWLVAGRGQCGGQRRRTPWHAGQRWVLRRAKWALGFDLNGVNSYVALPPNLFPYPASGTGNAPFSFELWFSTLTGGVILGQQNTTPFTAPSVYVPAIYVGTDGRLYVAMFWNMFARIISPGTVNDGAFHHVAVTYDGTTESQCTWMERLIGSRPFTQLGYSSNYHYQLGTGYTAGWPAANGGWFNFDGIIDEASLYNRALAAAEVAGIFAAGSSGKCPLFPGLPPQITSQPTDQSVALGANATFRVTAVNGPLTYQWQFNGQNLANSAHICGSDQQRVDHCGVGPSMWELTEWWSPMQFGSTLSAAAGLALAARLRPAPPGLIAWYKAEGNALDSADAHSGTLVNGVGFSPGKVGLGL